jgi:hypothetical protein
MKNTCLYYQCKENVIFKVYDGHGYCKKHIWNIHNLGNFVVTRFFEKFEK